MRYRKHAGAVIAPAMAISALILGASAAMADRGAIFEVRDVDIQQPAQRAIIAYNGVEEILILQTDVKADRETKVVEFMPLPSKPHVSLAPKGCFRALAQLIKKHNVRYIRFLRGKGEDEGAKAEAVKVVVAAQLGPHNVTVVEVKDADEFVRWVKAFFEKNGLGKPALGKSLKQIVADYLKRGFTFFAFDIVTLSPEKQTVQPLTYRFNSDYLYYPLKVTNLYGGEGTVELFVIHPKDLELRLRIAPRDSAAKYRFVRSSALKPGTSFYGPYAYLEPKETARMHPAIPALMEDKTAVFRAFKYEGPLHFDSDVWTLPCYRKAVLLQKFFQALQSGNAGRLKILVHVPFAFDGKEVIADKERLMAKFAEVLKRTRGKQFPIDNVRKESVKEHLFEDDFHRNFVEKHMRKQGYVVTVTAGEEQILLFLRQRHRGFCNIFGFKD